MSGGGRAAALAELVGARPVPPRFERFGIAYRIGLPVLLWIVFANGATRYRDSHIVPAEGLREAIQAEVASRHCPGLRLDETNFRRFTQAHGISHADLYQKRTARLRKDAAALERDLHADPEGGCRQMLDRYGRDGDAPHLLTVRG